MRAKLGLVKELPEDMDLANDLLTACEGQDVDFTNLFRALASLVRGNGELARAYFDDPAAFDAWATRYHTRLAADDVAAELRAEAMDRTNPIYIPRNHLVEVALKAANEGDMDPFLKLAEVLANPFDEQDGAAEFAEPAPASAPRHVTFCGT